MDLRTQYLGLDLPNPIVAGASPLADDVDTARRLEDAGVAALVMRSLFAEQVAHDELRAWLGADVRRDSRADVGMAPPRGAFALSPDDYVDQLRRLKEHLHIPVIASLSGTAPGPWLDNAMLLQDVGADAVELNLHPWTGADARASAFDVEQPAVDCVRALRARLRIPIAVKLSPYFTALARFAAQLHQAGADALVLFSSALPADIDTEALATVPAIELTRPSELLLRLRWLAILSSQVPMGLAASGGVHDATAAVKAILAGAHAVQMVSALLARGPGYATTVRQELADWLGEHDCTSLAHARGRLSLVGCPQPDLYERANAILALQRWQRPRSVAR